MFHERTKHIKVECHFICDLVIKKHIVTLYVRSEEELGDILTKSLARSSFSILCSRLGLRGNVRVISLDVSSVK